jgi:hypothetical protein
LLWNAVGVQCDIVGVQCRWRSMPVWRSMPARTGVANAKAPGRCRERQGRPDGAANAKGVRTAKGRVGELASLPSLLRPNKPQPQRCCTPHRCRCRLVQPRWSCGFVSDKPKVTPALLARS